MLIDATRTYLASVDALRLEGFLGESPSFSVIGTAGDGKEALGQILSLQPDFLVLDGLLPGLDGLGILDRLREEMPAPPRVLFLCPQADWAALALEKGADEALIASFDEEAFLEKARETALLPLPRLASRHEQTRLDIARQLLDELAIADRYKGKRYIQTAVSALACAPQLGESYTKLLYPYVSQLHSVSVSSVERAIRTAIEATWLHGSLEAIQRLFGLSVDADRGKPTNAEFLSMLAQHTRQELARRMRRG